MANDSNVDWQFSGSEVAKDASGAALSAYSSKLFALCDPNGKPILPPRVETAETSHTAVVHSVLCGLGNAYAPSIGLPAAKRRVQRIEAETVRYHEGNHSSDETIASISSTAEESKWNQVSPGKVGRTYEQKQNHTVISPSRFQLLADDGDPIGNPAKEEEQNDFDQGSSAMMMDEVEEGEILSKEDIFGEPVNKEGEIKKSKLFT
ncbi:hypothetical protein Bca101_076206 [Brassica carinata]